MQRTNYCVQIEFAANELLFGSECVCVYLRPSINILQNLIENGLEY